MKNIIKIKILPLYVLMAFLWGCGGEVVPDHRDDAPLGKQVEYFNTYILEAVDFLYADYGLQGYDIGSEQTHDIEYGPYGTIYQTGIDGKTMCVAAVMEVILTAMNIYVLDTNGDAVFDYLPKHSWEGLGPNDIKAHIWVNHGLDSYGTADALANFGMGECLPFERLTPGSFVGINRTTGTGHAVVFLSFVDAYGHEYVAYPQDAEIIGFKYFSSQGEFDVGSGGLDYRYAIFSDYHGSSSFCSSNPGVCDSNQIPVMPYKRDINVIYSTNSHYLNTGMMLHPRYWPNTAVSLTRTTSARPHDTEPFAFDPKRFDGITVDD